jgi:AcrR family transcriptional regulator
MQIDGISEVDESESRHDALLQAAVGVFSRYGFRKTSMDEVARAAGVSRQGLYLLFEDKEALFRRAVAYKLTRQLRAAGAELSNQRNSLEARIIGACDEWAGRYAGLMSADAADLMCASTSLAGGTLAHYEAQFEKSLVDAINGSALANHCTAAGLLPADVARAVHATARGLKHGSKSRQEFVQGMTAAVRMICAPLNPRPPQGVT